MQASLFVLTLDFVAGECILWYGPEQERLAKLATDPDKVAEAIVKARKLVIKLDPASFAAKLAEAAALAQCSEGRKPKRLPALLPVACISAAIGRLAPVPPRSRFTDYSRADFCLICTGVRARLAESGWQRQFSPRRSAEAISCGFPPASLGLEATSARSHSPVTSEERQFMINHLDRKMARGIIDQLGATGTPPAFGVRHFTVGLENYLEVLDHEYLNDYIAEGGSAFKLVKGNDGGGKTHFLYSVRDLAWEHNYAVAYTSLSIASGSPFFKPDSVFASIVNNLWPPLSAGEEHRLSTPGISMLLKTWYERRLMEYTSKGMSEEDARQAVLEDIHQVSNLSSTSFKNALLRRWRRWMSMMKRLSSVCASG